MEVNKISQDTKKSMKTRFITGLLMAIIGLPLIILGDWFFIALAAFIVVVSIWEILHVTKSEYPWFIVAIIYIFTISFVFWVFFQNDPQTQTQIARYDGSTFSFFMTDIRISTMGVGFLIALLFGYSIISTKISINDVFYLITMALFLGISVQSVLFLRFSPSALASNEGYEYPSRYLTCLLIFYVYGGTALNDIFAYFVGVLFGKHKLNERVSPKKTWEGLIGGIVFSAAITFSFMLICDLCFDIPILKGVIDFEHWYFALLISIAIPLFAVLGDLMFSLIKRHFEIKDFGKIFPGHGGVLDRFDSLLITSLLTTILITFIYHSPFSGAFQ